MTLKLKAGVVRVPHHDSLVALVLGGEYVVDVVGFIGLFILLKTSACCCCLLHYLCSFRQ